MTRQVTYEGLTADVEKELNGITFKLDGDNLSLRVSLSNKEAGKFSKMSREDILSKVSPFPDGFKVALEKISKVKKESDELVKDFRNKIDKVRTGGVFEAGSAAIELFREEGDFRKEMTSSMGSAYYFFVKEMTGSTKIATYVMDNCKTYMERDFQGQGITGDIGRNVQEMGKYMDETSELTRERFSCLFENKTQSNSLQK